MLQGSFYLLHQSNAKKYIFEHSIDIDMFMLLTSVGENLICAGSPALGASMCRGSNNNIILTIRRHASNVWQCSGQDSMTRCLKHYNINVRYQSYSEIGILFENVIAKIYIFLFISWNIKNSICTFQQEGFTSLEIRISNVFFLRDRS